METGVKKLLNVFIVLFSKCQKTQETTPSQRKYRGGQQRSDPRGWAERYQSRAHRAIVAHTVANGPRLRIAWQRNHPEGYFYQALQAFRGGWKRRKADNSLPETTSILHRHVLCANTFQNNARSAKNVRGGGLFEAPWGWRRVATPGIWCCGGLSPCSDLLPRGASGFYPIGR